MDPTLNAEQWRRIKAYVRPHTQAELEKKHGGLLGRYLAGAARWGFRDGAVHPASKPLPTSLITEALRYCRTPNLGDEACTRN